jgi:hypothetical protein
MKNSELFLSEIIKYDKTIQHNVKLSIFKETFCFNCNGSKLNQQNIANNKISLFTFDNEMSKHALDVTHHNIANDFLSYASQCKYKTTNFTNHIKNYVDIKKYIDTECNEKLIHDMRILKREASVVNSNNNEKNLTCSRLLLKLMEQCQERFTDMDNTICSIPFLQNDTINYFYTIRAGTISRTYLIKLILV